MDTTHKTIDDYISTFSSDDQKVLQLIRETIKKEVPQGEEAIKYGMPTFRLHDKNLVHFAAYEHHYGFYPTPSPLELFQKELSEYKTSKGAIQFAKDKPIPLELIRKLVQHRVKEVLEKQ